MVVGQENYLVLIDMGNFNSINKIGFEQQIVNIDISLNLKSEGN